MLIARSDSIAATTQSGNVLAGETFEFLPARGRIRIRATASAASLRMTVSIGGIKVANQALIPSTNRWPVLWDDYCLTTSGNAGERIEIAYLNTTAGALTAITVVEIEPF